MAAIRLGVDELKSFLTSIFLLVQRVLGAPECMSYVFNAEGKCTSYTGGYVMDRRVGNTQVGNRRMQAFSRHVCEALVAITNVALH